MAGLARAGPAAFLISDLKFEISNLLRRPRLQRRFNRDLLIATLQDNLHLVSRLMLGEEFSELSRAGDFLAVPRHQNVARFDSSGIGGAAFANFRDAHAGLKLGC